MISVLLLLIVLQTGAASNQGASAHQNIALNIVPEAVTLELGKPIEREFSADQEHSYQIVLAEGQYARLMCEQRGFDLVVELFGTNGRSIADFDSEFTNRGEEKIELVAETAGNYRLVIKPKYPKLSTGRYEIRWTEVREATQQDRLLQEGRRLRAESKRLSDAGKYTEALPPAERALELQERVLGAEHPELYHPLINLFVINFFKGNHAQAEAVCTRALTITESGLGPEHPLVARSLYNLAVFYSTRGDDARAEPLLQRALLIQEKVLGPDHVHVAHTLNRLAVLSRKTGDFVRAESLFQRALMISEKVLGEEHDDVGNALSTMAALYREKGDYVRAEPLYQRALAIYEKKRGSDHPFLAPPLHNLATLYRDVGEFDKAERLYQRAISIREKAVGPNHPDVAGSRASLALLYYLRGDYALALPLYTSALATLEKALGPNHPLLAWHLTYVAKLYIALNDHPKAESLYHRALGIYETTYGSNSYYLADILGDLAKLAAVKGERSQMVAFQARANAIIEYHLHLNLATGSERQKIAYLAKLPEQMDHAISLHLHFAADNKAARELAATTVLQRKGRVQDALSDNLASLRSRFSSEDQSLLDQLNGTTSRLARLVLNDPQSGSPAEHAKQIKALEERREKLESEIGNRSAEFFMRSQPISLATVRAMIPNNAVLIEFAVYRPIDPKAADEKRYGEPQYVAYVILSKGEVLWAKLGSTQEIDNAVDALRQALRDPKRSDVQQLARSVDEKLMRPVRTLVGDTTHLLISPDGQLNLLPFAALVDEENHYLVERYSFTYLTSGRDLLRLQLTRAPKSNPLLIADPWFGEANMSQVARMASRPSSRTHQRKSVTNTRDLSDVYFAPLNGTALEANMIHALFPEASLLSGAAATESALRKIAAPRLLHIATHGFFLQDAASSNTLHVRALPRSISATKIDNPLLRSGLALAGANLRNTAGDDGILTALEASGLNLWGTKLVVLSACDTGVGQVRNGEGVYGLRRALVLAGAESIVMSLWPASDYTTRKLMTDYYKNLKQGMGRGDSLRQVQLNMLKRDPHLHPFYWANFIQAGDWSSLNGRR